MRIPEDKKNFILSSLCPIHPKQLQAWNFIAPSIPSGPWLFHTQNHEFSLVNYTYQKSDLFPFNLDLTLVSTYSNSSTALTHFTESWTTPLQPTFIFFFLYLALVCSGICQVDYFSLSFPPCPSPLNASFLQIPQTYYDDFASYHTLGFCKRIIPNFTLLISLELIQLGWKLLLALQIEPKLPTAILLTVDHHGRRSCLTTKQYNPRVC